LRFQCRVAVDLDWPVEAEGFVRTDVVEDLPVGFGFPVQVGQGIDLLPVEVLVLQRPERPFPDPVLAWALRRVRMWSSSGREAMNAANAWPLNAAVGDQLDPGDLPGLRVGERLDQGRAAGEALGLGDRQAHRGDGVGAGAGRGDVPAVLVLRVVVTRPARRQIPPGLSRTRRSRAATPATGRRWVGERRLAGLGQLTALSGVVDRLQQTTAAHRPLHMSSSPA
jgi:hypothetical protein